MIFIDDEVYAPESDPDDDTDNTQDDKDPDDLLSALLSNPDVLRAAATLFNKDKPAKRGIKLHTVANCRSYTTIRHYVHCLNCGHTTVHSTKLHEKESITITKKNGDSTTYHYNIIPDSKVLESYTTNCEACYTRIKEWSRDELEYEYMSLLKECGSYALCKLQQRRLPRFNVPTYREDI